MTLTKSIAAALAFYEKAHTTPYLDTILIVLRAAAYESPPDHVESYEQACASLRMEIVLGHWNEPDGSIKLPPENMPIVVHALAVAAKGDIK